MATNAMMLYGLFIVIAVVVVVWMVILQFGPSGEKYSDISTNNAFRSERIDATRGNILSDDGRILATSIPTYTIRMDFAVPGLTDSLFEAHCVDLSEHLRDMFPQRTAAEYLEILRLGRARKARYQVILPRRVDHVELQALRKFPLWNLPASKSGFIAEQTYARQKPYGLLARRTIGFVNSQDAKVGLEGGFDDRLRGTEGLDIKQKTSGNKWIKVQSPNEMKPVDGLDVRSTINIEMQGIVQRALNRQVAELGADWGTVVVMEVKTGHIKAIANITQRRDSTLLEDYNYAVGMSQEPGSTFKLPVMLALLDNSDVGLARVFDTERGVVEFGEAKVVDTKWGGYGRINMNEIFVQSSNIGMAKAINQVYGGGKAADFVDDILGAGIGRELGLQITGEPRPTVKDPRIRRSGWDGTSLTMMSFGYAISVTPLQTLAVFNAVANDGVMMRPLLVDALLEKGEVVEHIAPEIIRPMGRDRIAKPSTIKSMQQALKEVVSRGTGKNLSGRKYQIAAKTGTAQIAQGRSGYTTSDGSRHYLGSVAGYFPADNPKYSIIVAMKTYYEAGSGKTYYGGALAAPLFGEIADSIYRTSLDFVVPRRVSSAGGAPRGNSNWGISGQGSGAGEGRVIKSRPPLSAAPRVVGMDYGTALRTLEERGFEVTSAGYGRVVGQEMLTDTLGNATGTIHLRLSL